MTSWSLARDFELRPTTSKSSRNERRDFVNSVISKLTKERWSLII